MPKVQKKPTVRLFDSKDVEILAHAVSIHPNLELACYATKLAKERLKFPIKSYSGVEPIFRVSGLPEKIAQRKLSPVHLKKFFPKEFFPIEDHGDFLGKVLAALSWGDMVHHHERILQNPERVVAVGKPFAYSEARR